ncbi:MAG: hypothetical protein RL086_560 [Bacteroidota bacterium]|jgi:hypothetical protein
MKKDTDYLQDIGEIRSLMERSSKFISLSGWAGIFAGIYALVGVYVAITYLHFNPQSLYLEKGEAQNISSNFLSVVLLALAIFLLAITTAIYFTRRRAKKKEELLWTPAARRLMAEVSLPLIIGGVLLLICLSKGLIGFLAPLSLLFYGLALYTISKFTYVEVRVLGLIEIVLGLAGAYFVNWGILFWAIGFGVVHIVYGIYVYFKYER